MFLMPILKGVVLGAVGAVVGAVVANLVGNATGAANTTEPSLALGYLLAVLGWLAGTGGYDMFITEWLGKPRPVENQKGFARYFRFNTDHKVVGVQYLVTFFADRKSTRLNSSHTDISRMPSSA